MPAQEITVLWDVVGHLSSKSAVGNNPPRVYCLLAEPICTRYLY